MRTLTEESSNRGTKIAKGVYATTVEVVSVENKSNVPGQDETQTIGQNGFTPEICLIVTYKVDDFERKMFLFGKYKKDKDTGAMKGWDSFNNAVLKFALAIKGKIDLEDDWSINQPFLDSLIGESFIKVSYISNRGYTNKEGVEKDYSYNDWNRTFPVGTEEKVMEREWSDNVQWVKDYFPTKIDQLAQERKEEEESFNPDDLPPADEPVI